MKAKYVVSLFAVASIVGVATWGGAADYGTTSGSPSSAVQTQPAPSQPVSGTVQNVDSTNSVVQIKDSSGNVQSVKVDNNTQITREGTVIQLADLRTGDVVTVKNANSSM